jgi:hypothetical protein
MTIRIRPATDARRARRADHQGGMLLRPSARWQRAIDVAVCLLVAAPLSLNAFVIGTREGGHSLTTAVVIPAASLPLLWRRRFPVAVLAVELAVLVAAELNPPVGFPAFGLLAALYTVASLRPRTTSLPAAAATLLALVPVTDLSSWIQAMRLGFQASLLGFAWTAGEVVRLRRAELAALEARAERAVAEAAVAYVRDRFGGDQLYARVDLLPGPDGPVVVELELVEPSLFLGDGEGSAARFAAAIAERT